MKEKVSYYVQLVHPYEDKYGKITSVNKKIDIRSTPNKFTTRFYASFGKDSKADGFCTIPAEYSEDFTELDYVMKHKEVIVQYGHGSAEFDSVPCRLFKKVTKTEEFITEL